MSKETKEWGKTAGEMPDITKRIKDLEDQVQEKNEKIRKLESQNAESTDLLKEVDKERTEADIMEAGELVAKILRRTPNIDRAKLTHLPTWALRKYDALWQQRNAQDFVDYHHIRNRELESGKTQDGTTVGAWDPVKKKYVGGI